MQGTWPILYDDILIQDWLIATSIDEVLLQLADGRAASEYPIWGHAFPCINKVSTANQESDIAPPPQLNKITNSFIRVRVIAP